MAEPTPAQWQDSWRETRAKRLAADLDARLAAQRDRELRAVASQEAGAIKPAGGTVSDKYWSSNGKTGTVVGGQFVPRESYNLMKNFKELDYDTAVFWGLGHSWISNFGLTGAEAEGEDPRVRCLVAQSTPSVVLMELHSLSTFNMLDPVIGQDIQAMQEAVNDCLLQRTRSTHDYPLGYVLQGAGPHFCPGGNHHPVNPPGGTPFTMSTHITSQWNVQFREHAMPGITAITGSAVGGGVAIATNTTQRVAASNASMAFGNLSRGASPLMWLSKNLVEEVGMAGAVSLYLTDSTVSAYGALQAGLTMGVAPNIPAAKNRAFMLAKSIVGTPAGRLVCHQLCDLNTQRFAMESTGFMFNAKSGSMFANVAGKAKKKKSAAHEAVALSPKPAGKPPAFRTLKDAEGLRDQRDEGQRSTAAGSRKARPRPFPERIGTQPVTVSTCDSPCGQCGARGAGGTIYGDTYYCEACWPRAEAAPPRGQNTPGAAAERTKVRCSTCGGASHGGQWGGGVYGSEFYCTPCWRKWQGIGRGPHAGAGFVTDASTTDRGYDTDATLVNSDILTDVDDSEWW